MVMSMLKQIPEDIVKSVRASNDIVDVIGEYVQLKKQGRNYFGLCPFHGENTPSFSVTQDKQVFYCFGCKKGGNVFTFLMELEGYTFYETVKILADRSGIDLPELNVQDSNISKKNQDILAAYEWLAKLYHHILRYTKEGKEGYEYLIKRGINDESIEAFQLGYAPLESDFTIEFLKKKGFNIQLLIKARLLKVHDDNRLTDPFAGRIVFPIRNHLGKTIAFSARAIRDQKPKYLNSSENDLFQKNRILFNFDLAKRHIRKENTVILFEGQMDVMSAYQAGINNIVATLGSSLTENQAKLLNRYVDTVVICYDGDQAGLEASFKAAKLLRKIGCQVKVSDLKEGLDPDGYIKKYGSKSFENDVISTSYTFISFYMKYLKKDYNLSLEGDRIRYIQKVLKEIAKIESSVEREHYLRDLSDEYNLSLDALNEEINVFRKNRGFHKDNREKNRYTNSRSNVYYYENKKLLPAFQNAERQLIAYMLQDKAITDRVQKELEASFHIEEHKIIATYLYAYYEDEQEPNISMFIERLSDEALKQLVIEISMLPILNDISEKEISDYIKIIQSQTTDVALIDKYRKEQKLAEQQKDHLKSAQIAMKIIEIEKKLKNKRTFI